jgi:pyruvate dehydrogenase (quinone)
VPFAQWARTVGLLGLTCSDDDRIGDVWDEALAADRPVVIEARVDPEVAPMPPHITQAVGKNFVRSFLRGDSEALGILRKSGQQKFQEFKESLLPGRDS